jgi:SAM-dependent methyltransferase
MKPHEIKNLVREKYGKVALTGSTCCSGGSSCCGETQTVEDIAGQMGYGEDDLQNVPHGANLGLGCGNPVALASIKEGEIVLDLGSGAGFDCFLAANRVGKTGKVIGVDMTHDMLDKARENAMKGDYGNVEFRLGEIEHLPVPDNHVDVILSNCVINLSPQKDQVFREAHRVLKVGGRLMISDIVLLRDLPPVIRGSMAAYVGCIAGAVLKDQYLDAIQAAGFRDIRVVGEDVFPMDAVEHDPATRSALDGLNLSEEALADMARSVVSMKVSAVKPG